MWDWRQQARQGCPIRVPEVPRPGCRDMPVQRRQRQWVRRDGCCRTTLPTGQYLHRLRAYTQGQPRPMRRLLRQARCAQGVDVH